MKKIFSTLCGICATAFIVTTIFTISSCSQDDDYYESDMYTMAEPLETRAAEPGGGGEPEGNAPQYTHSANMGNVSVKLKKNGLSGETKTVNVLMYILADSAFQNFGAHVTLNPEDGSCRSSSSTKIGEDPKNYFFRVHISAQDRRLNYWKGDTDVTCPIASFN